MDANLTDISVAFGSLQAVDAVSLGIQAGKIHALVGENGAGKSTLMNVLFGLVRPDSGQVSVGGKVRHWASPQDAIRAGLGMVHQHFMLQENMTVLENIVLCSEPLKFLRVVDFGAARRKLAQGFDQHGINVHLDARVGDLSVGQKQVVEILKVLYRDASLLILDEPTAVLTPLEITQLFGMLKNLVMTGKSVAIITHRLDDVMAIADHVSVMRGGRLISSLPLAQTSRSKLAAEIVGGDLPSPIKPSRKEVGQVVLGLRGLRLRAQERLIGPIDLDVHGGEIVGIAGVSGNGQAELMQAIVGLRSVEDGQIALMGRRVERCDVRKRRTAGLSYIPEDRQSVGLALSASVEDNASAGREVRKFARGPFLDRSAMSKFAQSLIDRFQIKVRGPKTAVSFLSGGNKQKLVVGRELSHSAPLIVAENPTWGVDLGATEQIHREIMCMRDQGHAVLLVSTELNEILALSDRIFVMYSGTLTEAMGATQTNRERIGELMTSHNPHQGIAT